MIVARGVSLIELIIVIVAVTIGVVLLGDAYLSSARSVAVNENAQIAWQVAQACADHTLGRVRRPGAFANVVAGSDPCVALPANGTAPCPPAVGFATVTDGPASGTEPCAVGPCRTVAICVRRGGYDATITFMFVDS
jgi:type II secretory pathway pseudopilin PulG